MSQNFIIPSSLSDRDAEVISDQIQIGLGEGRGFFHFTLETDFLPTVGWFERFRGILAPIVASKKSLEISSHVKQLLALRSAGFHLIADITESSHDS